MELLKIDRGYADIGEVFLGVFLDVVGWIYIVQRVLRLGGSSLVLWRDFRCRI